MELKGKKIAFLGDSITEGVGASKPEDRFTDVFGRLSGATAYNHGISATTAARNGTRTSFFARTKSKETPTRW